MLPAELEGRVLPSSSRAAELCGREVLHGWWQPHTRLCLHVASLCVSVSFSVSDKDNLPGSGAYSVPQGSHLGL